MCDNEVCSSKTKDLCSAIVPILTKLGPKYLWLYIAIEGLLQSLKTFVLCEQKAQIWSNFAHLGQILGQIGTKTVQIANFD